MRGWPRRNTCGGCITQRSLQRSARIRTVRCPPSHTSGTLRGGVLKKTQSHICGILRKSSHVIGSLQLGFKSLAVQPGGTLGIFSHTYGSFLGLQRNPDPDPATLVSSKSELYPTPVGSSEQFDSTTEG